jgi:hypothetical protein
MKSKRFIGLFLALGMVFSLQFSGINYAFSAALAVPGNVVVRTSTNATYLNASLTVTWDEVAGATAYAVMATRAGTTKYSAASVSGEKNTQAVISGLIGGVSYVVQVRTIKDTDASAWSSDSLIATPTTLPKAVDKPSAIAGVGSATVTWTALTGTENGGSPVTSYVVTESNSGKSVSVAATESSAEVTGLTEGAAAIFRVQAITAVSTTGSTSLASDEITTLTAGGGSGDSGNSSTPSAAPEAPIAVAPTDQGGQGSSGGTTGGGFFGGGGGGGFGPLPLPSPPGTESPSPSPSATPKPLPTNSIPPENTPLQPIATKSPSPSATVKKSPSPSPSPSKSLSANSYLGTVSTSKDLQFFSLKGSGSNITIKASKNLAIVLPVQKAGVQITVKLRAPNGAIFALPTITTTSYGSVRVPTIDFKKPGKYSLVIAIGGKTSSLAVNVSK